MWVLFFAVSDVHDSGTTLYVEILTLASTYVCTVQRILLKDIEQREDPTISTVRTIM